MDQAYPCRVGIATKILLGLAGRGATRPPGTAHRGGRAGDRGHRPLVGRCPSRRMVVPQRGGVECPGRHACCDEAMASPARSSRIRVGSCRSTAAQQQKSAQPQQRQRAWLGHARRSSGGAADQQLHERREVAGVDPRSRPAHSPAEAHAAAHHHHRAILPVAPQAGWWYPGGDGAEAATGDSPCAPALHRP